MSSGHDQLARHGAFGDGSTSVWKPGFISLGSAALRESASTPRLLVSETKHGESAVITGSLDTWGLGGEEGGERSRTGVDGRIPT